MINHISAENSQQFTGRKISKINKGDWFLMWFYGWWIRITNFCDRYFNIYDTFVKNDVLINSYYKQNISRTITYVNMLLFTKLNIMGKTPDSVTIHSSVNSNWWLFLSNCLASDKSTRQCLANVIKHTHLIHIYFTTHSHHSSTLAS